MNALLEQAKQIDERATDEEQEVANQPVNQSAVGSFERVIAAFGNTRAWAGR